MSEMAETRPAEVDALAGAPPALPGLPDDVVDPSPTPMDPEAVECQVWDETAQAEKPPRRHTFGNPEVGFKDYTFVHGEPTRVKLAHARTVVKIPEFKILMPTGERLLPMRSPSDKGAETMTLRNDQVIASFDELSDNAIYLRAARHQRHRKYDPQANRQEAIRFLMDRAADEPPAPPERQRKARAPREIDLGEGLSWMEDIDEVSTAGTAEIAASIERARRLTEAAEFAERRRGLTAH